MNTDNTATDDPALSQKTRQLFIYSGEHGWALQQAKIHLQSVQEQIWITTQIQAEPIVTLPSHKAFKLLGQETRALVYDAFCGFNVDALGLASGIVRGGGIIILLTPSFKTWPNYDDPEYQRLTGSHLSDRITARFIQRTIQLINSNAGIPVIRQTDTKAVRVALPAFQPSSLQPDTDTLYQSKDLTPHHALTQDQHNAVENIIRTCRGHRHRPLIITAHRGRGKSSALGLAAAWLLQQTRQTMHILITAPRPDSVKTAFACAKSILSDKIVQETTFCLQTEKGSFEFIAPDALEQTTKKADVVFIDEASAIPIPLLEQFLTDYPRVIFSSTLHGYEGTGQGFTIRFGEILNKKTPGWKKHQITSPIRWAKNDPVEDFIFELLGFNHSIIPDQQAVISCTKDYIHTVISQDELLINKNLLNQLLSLLTLSHYQTKPSDFRQLLDSPDMEVHVVKAGDTLLGAALITLEESIPPVLHDDIIKGKRRLRGRLLPQLLSTQCNAESALSLSAARIQRIAIHPAINNKGIGSFLLNSIKKNMEKRPIDYIGSNFGATEKLLTFWKKNGFDLVGLSSSRDASSGSHAATVVYPITKNGIITRNEALFWFKSNLPHLLKSTLQMLETNICSAALNYWNKKKHTDPFNSTHPQQKALIAYARGYRCYDYILFSLHDFFWQHIIVNEKFSLLSKREQTLLIMKIAQGHNWKNCVYQLKLTGKKAAEKQLRAIINIFTDIG